MTGGMGGRCFEGTAPSFWYSPTIVLKKFGSYRNAFIKVGICCVETAKSVCNITTIKPLLETTNTVLFPLTSLHAR
jgi:hypothetical protein